MFNAEQVRQFEPAAAQTSGCGMYDLMERAGEAAFRTLTLHWPDANRVLILTGAGNNGGDGFVLARLASDSGMEVVVASPVADKPLKGDALTAQQAWAASGGALVGGDEVDYSDADVIVDALLGTGLSGEVRAPFVDVIAAVNASDTPVLSIDIPSGLAADSGQVLGQAVQAQVTVTFVAIKAGLVTGQGRQYSGHLVWDDLAIGPAFTDLAEARAQKVGFYDFKPLPARANNAHKGHFGRLLCIGGNRGMAGAIRLCAEAALRTGTGLVKVHCHHDSVLQVSQGRSELMVGSDNLSQQMAWADTLVLGPGLGQDSWSRSVFNEVISYLMHEDMPVIIDADGLNLLSDHLYKLKLSNLVITPHPAEAARLLNKTTAEVEADRYAAVQQLAEKFVGTAVLKGAGSIVQHGARTLVCADGNPGMATAGMGDVLSGVIGGMLAQGMRGDDAGIFATCLHAAAGDLVAEQGGQRGMLASDLFPLLRQLINK